MLPLSWLPVVCVWCWKANCRNMECLVPRIKSSLAGASLLLSKEWTCVHAHLRLTSTTWQTCAGKPQPGGTCRSSGEGGAINPSCSGRDPSDDRMPKAIQFWCLNPKTSCPVLWKMNFSQKNWMKGACAFDIPDRKATKLCVWGWRKCFVMVCESLVISREAGFRAQGARAWAGQQHCAGNI